MRRRAERSTGYATVRVKDAKRGAQEKHFTSGGNHNPQIGKVQEIGEMRSLVKRCPMAMHGMEGLAHDRESGNRGSRDVAE